MPFCQPFGYYERFKTHEVKAGDTGIGGKNPIRVQSMVNTATDNIEATVNQSKSLSDAGCELVRITVRNLKDVEFFRKIQTQLRNDNYPVPLVADVHFNPELALKVAEFAEKVRINPGNYSDISKSSHKKSFSESEFRMGKERIFENIKPLIEVCRKNGTALRLGVNHGSLSWRMVERYGNGPAGMVATAMEFLEIFESERFNNIVVSMKASNPFTMIYATRLLVQKMKDSGMTFPLHLGVTEAGFGNEGIYRSALGTGALLCDGIGDTVRVSLSGNPLQEIPVCQKIIQQSIELSGNNITETAWPYEPFGNNSAFFKNKNSNLHLPDIVDKEAVSSDYSIIECDNKPLHEIRKEIVFHYKISEKPIFLTSNKPADISHAVITGALLSDGLIAGWAVSEKYLADYIEVLRSSGLMHYQTIFVSCPTCGRTSYDLEAVAKEVKKRIQKIPRLKIAIMGCIVNGPGEMEDADYGILGEQGGRVSIYKGKVCIIKGIESDKAAETLEEIIINNRHISA